MTTAAPSAALAAIQPPPTAPLPAGPCGRCRVTVIRAPLRAGRPL
jgi:hypothetical protein